MKKTPKAVMMIAGFFLAAQLSAQSVREGINHLYADRDQSAKAVFEKLIASNPNNLEAIYWLGQTYLEMQDVEAARQLYDKTLASNGNAPIVLVGRGHVDLMDKKANEAHQRFEAALTASRSRKGDDPEILNAIGRACADYKTKDADVAYGIEKLKAAPDRVSKKDNVLLGDIYLNLGDAYRKAHDGSGAVTSYQSALTADPTLARAQFRTAMIYYTQRNWDVYLEDLNKTITIDPSFAPAYYELYYYNFYRQKYKEADEYAKKYIANSDADVQMDYFVAQTAWANKDYKSAISTLDNIIAKAGDKTKPRTYKLMAYSYADMGDSVSAKKYVDEYFAKADDEDVIPQDVLFKAQVYSATGSDDATVMKLLENAVAMDTIYKNKIDILQDAIETAKVKGNKEMQAALGLMLYKTRKEPYHTDLFNAGFTYYQGGLYAQADTVFSMYNRAYPDSIYGWFWSGRTNIALDTTLAEEPYLSNMITGFKKSLEIAAQEGNKDRFKTQAIQSSQFLAGIYNNTKKDKDSAIYFIQKGLEFDPANATLTRFLEVLQKPSRGGTKPSSSGGNNGSKSSSKMMRQEANADRTAIAAR